MNTNINARDYLEKCGIKPSLQRIAIVEYLMENRIHPTADDIYHASCHAHFQCCACNRVFDIPVEKIGLLNTKQIGDLYVTETHLYYKGYCKACRNKTAG